MTEFRRAQQIPMFPEEGNENKNDKNKMSELIVDAVKTFETDKDIFITYLKKAGIENENVEMLKSILQAVRLYVGEKNGNIEKISDEDALKQVMCSKLTSICLGICRECAIRKRNNNAGKEKIIEKIPLPESGRKLNNLGGSNKPDYKKAAAGEEVERRTERG